MYFQALADELGIIFFETGRNYQHFPIEGANIVETMLACIQGYIVLHGAKTNLIVEQVFLFTAYKAKDAW